MEIKSYNVGIRFSPIGNSWRTEETTIHRKHWALVFTPTLEPTNSRVIELLSGGGKAVVMVTNDLNFKLPSHPLAVYEGNLSDTDRILEAHPMRGTFYAPCFNNCQHFAAIFLLLLKAYALLQYDRSFRITHNERMTAVRNVLIREGTKLYNSPNIYLQFAQLSPIPLGGVAFAACTVAAEATVVSTIPAAGIMGWLGMTTTVVAPTATAVLAASVAPIAAASTVIAGAGYMWRSRVWKDKTTFDNPSISGFPRGARRPLSRLERIVTGSGVNWGSEALSSYSSIATTASELGASAGRTLADSFLAETAVAGR
jgi:hypothetical protein